MPEGEIGYYWSGYQDIGKGRSLLRLLDEHSDDLRGRFFQARADFLSSLSQTLNSFPSVTKLEIQLLWMSLLVESCVMKPTVFLDVFRLLALEQALGTKNIEKIQYVGPKTSVAEALRQLSQRRNLDFYWEKTPTQHKDSFLKRMWRRLPEPLRSLIWLFRYVYQRWSLRALRETFWFEGSKAVFVFSVFAHMDKNSCNSKKFYSKQWEVLPEILRSAGKLMNWAHLFLFSKDVPDTSTGLGWLKSFNRNSQDQGSHVFLDTFLNLRLILKCLLDWARIQFLYFQRKRKIESPLECHTYGWIWPILKKDWRDSVTGITAMNNILLIHLFDRLLRAVPYQKQGFYLCENQSWERAFVHAWRKHGHGRIIGVGHATIRYWDLRYYDATIATVVPDLPRPDALAVNGPAAWLNMQKAGQPMERCVRVEALRYVNLYKLGQDSEKMVFPRAGKRRLLVLGDIQWETTHRMMLILEHLYEKLDVPHEIWVKSHPHNQIKLKNYPKLEAIYKDSPLKELLSMIDVTFASVFTSGELDSYCLGVPVIHYLDPHNLNFSNLREVKSTKFISTAVELYEALKHVELEKCKTGKPGDFFWLDPKLPKWKALLE